MRPRLQFSLRFLLMLVLAVSCFLAGAVWQKQQDEPEWIHRAPSADKRKPNSIYVEHLRLPDGTEWHRSIQDEFPASPAAGMTTGMTKPGRVLAPTPDE